ncbi:tol-pal system protein YbgF [Thalassolituus sp. LLYu03]|uniref:tol-pal system protein YbgF n=1 Tax=Thalassolituus sp. LLYu03 TaxID=3421656 RepID=UPI003D2E59AB
MKAVVLIALASLSVSALADDQWVSVGAARAVAPATPGTSVDSSSRVQVVRTTSTEAAESNGLVAELYQQMEQMQQELAALRDRVEEQDHQIRRMKQDQQERYLDLDRRFSALMSSPASQTPVAGGAVPEASVAPADAYKQAQKLMYEKKYAEANTAYVAFVRQYPDDPLAVNAIYWSGEIYLLQGDLDKALESFRSVVTKYPEHQKVPDAMYKMGYTLDKQGKTADAKTWMKKVVDKYTGKADTVVRLAKNYLDSH